MNFKILYQLGKSYAKHKNLRFLDDIVDAIIGPRPGHISIQRGKIISTPKYNNGSDLSSESNLVAKKIQQNYENAMHKRRDYTYKGLETQLADDGMVGIKAADNNSLLLQAGADLNDAQIIFHPTHFAPETMRQGAALIDAVGHSSQPTIFTVTNDLTGMLEKSGFKTIGQIPQRFGDQIVMKDILVNDAVTPKVIDNYARNATDWGQPSVGVLTQLKEALLNLPERRVQLKPRQFEPRQSRFPLSELLKKSR